MAHGLSFHFFGPKLRWQLAGPSALGLSHVGQAGLQLWDKVTRSQSFCCFGPESRAPSWSAALGLCLGQLASAPVAHPHTQGFRCVCPAGVSGVGGQLGFQLWAPSLLIWVCTTRLQVGAGAASPAVTVQGLTGEGLQRPRLLQGIL